MRHDEHGVIPVPAGGGRLVLSLLVLAAAVAVVYGGTLQVPWYFDDHVYIVNGDVVRDLPLALRRFFLPRGPGVLTFALNYRFGGLSLPGYHLVNILIHGGAGYLVLLLLRRIFAGVLLPLAGALLFVVHPVQTQAVTYVVQRFTSLSALLLLAALLLFVRCRELRGAGRPFGDPSHLLYYGGCLVCGGLAVLVKQNAVVLPVLMYLFDRYYLRRMGRDTGSVGPYLLPFAVVGAAAVVWQLLLPLASGTPLRVIATAVQLGRDNDASPLRYLVTEFSVILTYLRMLVLPYGLALDHAWPLTPRIISPANLAAGAGVAALLAAAWLLRRRLRHLSFGILWFLTALAVESSVIVLDPMFDHRLYLPLAGFCIAVTGVLERLPARSAVVVALLLVTVYGTVAWRRNALWNDPVAFYTDNARVAPRSYRARNELGRLLLERGDLGRAEVVLKEGLAINPFSHELYDNLGTLYDLKGDRQASLACFRKAIGINMYYDRAYANMGVVYAGLGEWGEAERLYREALRLNGSNGRTWYNLGVALYGLKRLPESLEAFRRAAAITPGDEDTLFSLGSVAAELGDRPTAESMLVRLRAAGSGRAGELAGTLTGSPAP